MPRYPFTGAYERIITPLQYGPGVRVERGEQAKANPPYDQPEYSDPDGATVLLFPGDVLVTDEEITFSHPEIEGSPVPAPPDPNPVQTPEQPTETTASAPRRSRSATTTTTDTPTPSGDAAPAV